MSTRVQLAVCMLLALALLPQMTVGQPLMLQTSAPLRSVTADQITILADQGEATFEINKRTRICVGKKDAKSTWKDLKTVENVTVVYLPDSKTALSIRDGVMSYALIGSGFGQVDHGCRPWAENEGEEQAEDQTGEQARSFTSADIRQVQELLTELGYEPGPADGVAGGKTREAIRRFEAASGLPISGVISENLIRRLREKRELSAKGGS